MLLSFLYVEKVWKELERMIGIREIWGGNAIEKGINKGCNNSIVKIIQA
jgi:hypothetical protein